MSHPWGTASLLQLVYFLGGATFLSCLLSEEGRGCLPLAQWAEWLPAGPCTAGQEKCDYGARWKQGKQAPLGGFGGSSGPGV